MYIPQQYKEYLEQWLGLTVWHWFMTLTNPRHRPSDWFWSKADRLLVLLSQKFQPFDFKYAGTAELTMDRIRHAHLGLAMLQVLTLGQMKALSSSERRAYEESLPGDVWVADDILTGHHYVRAGWVVFPKDWRSRQKAESFEGRRRQVIYVLNHAAKFHRIERADFYKLDDAKQLKLLRTMGLNLPMFCKFWYQCNYGTICDVQPVKSQQGFVRYMLKYLFKAQDDSEMDWMISDGQDREHFQKQMDLFVGENA